MLAKHRRLRTREVREVLREGVSMRAKLVSAKVLFARKTSGKIAVVVPMSVARGAVVRNRLRRSLYQALALAPLPPSGTHMVLCVRTIPAQNVVREFASDVVALIKKISRSNV